MNRFFKANEYAIKLMKVIFILICCFLLACENKTTNVAVTLDTNAYFAIFQAEPNAKWRNVFRRNDPFSVKTVTFTTDKTTTPYTMVFVCPSSRKDKPNEVHIFYSTPADMALLEFRCKVNVEDIQRKAVFGRITGLSPATLDNPQGELFRVALSPEITITSLDAYAEMLRIGKRDFVGFIGKENANGEVSPERFYLRRTISLADTIVPQDEKIDLSGKDSVSYIENFDQSKRSSINVTGVSEGETVSSIVGFLSLNKTFLTLAESQQTNFDFFPVPLKIYDFDADDSSAHRDEFNPGEGQEITVSVSDSQGFVNRKATKFFAESKAETHNIIVPPALSAPPTFALSDYNVDLQSIRVAWEKYQDNSIGVANLYQWEFLGIAAKFLEDNKPAVVSDQTKWIVSVSPGWLRETSRSDDNFTLVLPEAFPYDEVNDDNEVVSFWRQEWGFQSSSSVDWKLGAYVADINIDEENGISDNSLPGLLVDYILNRKVSSNVKEISISHALAKGNIQSVVK